MKKEHRNNLIKTAIFMLEHKYKMDMKIFQHTKDDIHILENTRIIPECGTTCCFAGHAPMALNEKKVGVDWYEYIKEKFGLEVNKTWRFLFNGDWTDSKNESAARLIYLLKHGVPEFIDYNRRFAKKRTKEMLIEELKGLFV